MMIKQILVIYFKFKKYCSDNRYSQKLILINGQMVSHSNKHILEIHLRLAVNLLDVVSADTKKIRQGHFFVTSGTKRSMFGNEQP